MSTSLTTESEQYDYLPVHLFSDHTTGGGRR